jgi:hypothetical protein
LRASPDKQLSDRCLRQKDRMARSENFQKFSSLFRFWEKPYK